jgi:hypothetical protein
MPGIRFGHAPESRTGIRIAADFEPKFPVGSDTVTGFQFWKLFVPKFWMNQISVCSAATREFQIGPIRLSSFLITALF